MLGTSNAARTRGGAAVSAWVSRHRDRSTNVARPNKHWQLRDFGAVNAAALAVLPTLVARWLPDGRREGDEWVARNPRRLDRRPGSFKINLVRGAWADFATGDRGGDVVSLAAYLFSLSQGDAARELVVMLGLEQRT